VLNWLATAAKGMKAARGGEKPPRGAPMLHAVGFILVLALGLATAVVSAVDATGESHTNYWSVGMQHTLFFGTGIVAFLAAMYYWGPKLWGHHLSEGLGKLQLGVLVLGLLLTVVPMFVLGIQDMHVHLSSYPDEENWQAANVAIGIGGAVTVFAVVLFILNLLVSVVAGRGRRADDDPWSGNTLEWATSSPPPPHDFDSMPEIRSETPLLDLRQPEGVNSP
jgi:cytochrome c oxidase subunit 1